VTVSFIPVPSADHDVPFHRRDAVRRRPARGGEEAARDQVAVGKHGKGTDELFVPVPSADHDVPFHRAM
jgi:hypothetical protein